MATMKALHFSASKGNVELIEVPRPTNPEPESVIIKVAFSGVCGTDLHIISREFASAEEVIMGHEMSGSVSEIGSKVNNVKVGDKVVLNPNPTCGQCRFCIQGQINYCISGSLQNPLGIFRPGGWAEYVCVQAKDVYKIPGTLSLKTAVLTEPLACVVHGLEKTMPIQDDAEIMVMGAGIIGSLWITLLHHHGYHDITVTEMAEGRRKFVQEMGLGVKVCHPNEVMAQFEGTNLVPMNDGYDVIIDTTGNPKAAEMGFGLLRRGGKMNIFGCCPKDSKMTISPAEFMLREVSVFGTLIAPWCFPRATKVVANMAEKYLDFNKLGIKMFKLEEHQEALKDLRKGIISKAIFEI